jgi:hypothetical protein
MKRREFLTTMSAATLLAPASLTGAGGRASSRQAANQKPAATPPTATVLYDGRAVTLTRATVDPKTSALWVQQSDLPRINEFELKPQGMCRADICVPVPATLSRGTTFNLTAFAQRVGQRIIFEPAARAWSFAEIPVVRGAYLESRIAPDVSAPDRKGRTVRLSQFRGKKVLLVTWASW